MQALTKKHREIVTQDKADFQHDMNLIPEKSGLKWQKIRLKNSSRKISKMGEPHQEFTIMKFCKEVHHETQRQRAKPFCQ